MTINLLKILLGCSSKQEIAMDGTTAYRTKTNDKQEAWKCQQKEKKKFCMTCNLETFSIYFSYFY